MSASQLYFQFVVIILKSVYIAQTADAALSPPRITLSISKKREEFLLSHIGHKKACTLLKTFSFIDNERNVQFQAMVCYFSILKL